MTGTTPTLADIIKANPDLSSYGWHFVRRTCDWNDGEKFDAYRQDMLSEDFALQVTTTFGWLRTHSLKRTTGSYGLKHLAERWGATVGLSRYVTNGAAICAALMLGYRAVRDLNGPNCSFKRVKA